MIFCWITPALWFQQLYNRKHCPRSINDIWEYKSANCEQENSVWWPGISRQIEDWVSQCNVCAEHSQVNLEPLLPTPLPAYPWQMVGADLFELHNVNYLLVVDYFSMYAEVTMLTTTTLSAVIKAMKSIFSRHGIPDMVQSDNGPQFDCQEFNTFANSFGFRHQTSSPRFPQSNGLVERAVKTTKKLLWKSSDPCIALLNYRASPLHWCGLSPTQLLMGRQVRTTLPQMQQRYIPHWSYLKHFQQQDHIFKAQQKETTTNVIEHDIYHHFQRILQLRSHQEEFHIHQEPLSHK